MIKFIIGLGLGSLLTYVVVPLTQVKTESSIQDVGFTGTSESISDQVNELERLACTKGVLLGIKHILENVTLIDEDFELIKDIVRRDEYLQICK